MAVKGIHDSNGVGILVAVEDFVKLAHVTDGIAHPEEIQDLVRRDFSTGRNHRLDEVVGDMAFEYFDEDAQEWVSGDTTYANYDEAYDAINEAHPGARMRQIGPKVTRYMHKTLYDLFYNDFLYDNSKGKIHIKVADVAPMEFDHGRLVDNA